LNLTAAPATVGRLKLIVLCLCSTILLLSAELSGRFKGDWSSGGSGSSGSIQLTIKPGDDAVQASAVTFDLNGTEVKTTIKTLRIAGGEIEMSYQFDLGGVQLISNLKGKLEGEKLAGTYRTASAGQNDAVDQGTFQAALVK
jgi:hypothetical protein